MGAAAVPIITAVVAAGASEANTRRTARKQDEVAAAGIRKQGETQREVNARLNRTLVQAEKSKPDEERGKAQQQYLDAIRRRAPQAGAAFRPTGVSSAFDAAAAGAAKQSTDYATDVAGLMARLDAPQLQRQNEGFSYGNLGMDLDVLGGNSRQDEFLNNLRLSRIRRNPYIDAGAAALSGYGSGYTPKG